MKVNIEHLLENAIRVQEGIRMADKELKRVQKNHFLYSTRCPNCGEIHDIWVPIEGYRRWQAGALIQEALPELPAKDRELLITGLCDKCFAKLSVEDD